MYSGAYVQRYMRTAIHTYSGTGVQGVRVCTTQASLGWRNECQSAKIVYFIFLSASEWHNNNIVVWHSISGTALSVKCKCKIISFFVGDSEYLAY